MKKYDILYSSVKSMIESGELKSGDKLLSVRKASEQYGVSVTTVSNAYFALCADGYIISKEKSGYTVSAKAMFNTVQAPQENRKKIYYDLSGNGADAQSFDVKLWQRYVKNALRQKERLLSYSEPQGEYDLRCAISDYIRKRRNVIASPERIVIGAGVQPLLYILSSLLKSSEKSNSISFPDESFALGRAVFKTTGYDVRTRDKTADVIYVSPSHMTRFGDVMPIKRRLELVKYSAENLKTVIEDDYESELLYNVRPTPSLYALGHKNIVYIGSFSAMLLPGIRISFMVLTDALFEAFKQNEFKYAQTASKTEQIALCGFIREGHISAQIRKARRIYAYKTKVFAEILKEKLPALNITIGENSLQIRVECDFSGSAGDFLKTGIKVFCEKRENGRCVLMLSPSAVPQEKLCDAADKLLKVLER